MKSILILIALGLLYTCYAAETISNPIRFATNNHWYQIVTPSSPVTYAQAAAGAAARMLKDKQGYLVTINDQNESNFLKSNYYDALASAAPNAASWTGARRASTDVNSTPKQVKDNWYWLALGRVSTAFSSSNACISDALNPQWCAWPDSSQPGGTTSTNYCMKAFFSPVSWASGDCNGGETTPFYIIEYDTPSTSCAAGYSYTATPYPQCVDVNECLTAGRCGAGYTCNNTPGSYSCTDINECLNANACPAGQTCSNTPGSFTCAAPTCNPSCQNSGTCSGSNVCSCTASWSGATCATPVCNPPCSNGATCTAPNTCSVTQPYVRIVNPASGYVLDTLLNADGFTYVVINEVADTDSQLWRVYAGYIQNKASGKVVDVKDNRIEPLRPIIAWDQKAIEYAGNQLWDVPDYGELGAFVVTSNPQFVLDIYEGKAQPNQPVNLWWAKTTDQGVDNQRWAIGGVSVTPAPGRR